MIRPSLIVAAFALSACDSQPEPRGEPAHQVAQPEEGGRLFAIAVLQPTAGNHVHGTVRFEETSVGVNVDAEVFGLDPNTKHGFHIHEFGDCSAPGAESAGDHFAPQRQTHGLPPAGDRHAGDMGNVESNDEGDAQFESAFTLMRLRPADRRSIIGRAVIIHEKEDDGGQPTGNAGARLACGVIGLASEKEPS